MSDEMIPGSATGPKLRFVRNLEGERRLKEVAESMGLAHGYLRAYTAGDMKVAVGHELYGEKWLKWHISVSRPDRCPTWDELKQAKYSLLPAGVDVEMQIIFPRKAEDYVDIHQFCLHLWEV